MATEPMIQSVPDGLVASLESQRLSLEGDPGLLAIYSNAPRSRSPHRWERAWDDALYLRTEAAEVESDEVAEAIEYALDGCGVREVALIVESSGFERADDAAPERGASIIDRIAQGARRHRESLDAAKDHVRDGIAKLRKQLAGRASVYGIIEVGEGGGLLGYDEVTDAFDEIA